MEITSFADPVPFGRSITRSIAGKKKNVTLTCQRARRHGAETRACPRGRGINSVVSQLVIGHVCFASGEIEEINRGMIHECKRARPTQTASSSRTAFSEFWHVTRARDHRFLIKILILNAREARSPKETREGREETCK